MSFAEPQTVTVSGVTSSLPRTNTKDNRGEYTSADGLIMLSASHAYGRRTRRVLRLDHSKIAPDVFVPATSGKLSMSCYLVFDLPGYGYPLAEAQAVYTGFKTQFSASSDALIIKLLGGES